MNTHKLIHSKTLLIAVSCSLYSVLAQPPPLPEDRELRRTIGENLTRLYGVTNIPFVSKSTKPGDASSGVEIARTKDTVSIDPMPCSNQFKGIVTFVKPYKESKISDVKCNGKTYSRIQVIQQ
jgi:hypothetical protein